MTGDKSGAMTRISDYFDAGGFKADLGALVSFPTESQTGTAGPILRAYLEDGITPRLTQMGFETAVFDNPVSGGGPLLVGTRIENADAPTVLIYGHGDVVYGQAGQWADEMEPFALHETVDRYYGRGVAGTGVCVG